ncbi:MAG TPA: histidine kinase [Sphingobacteriaceae bacterium]
MTNSVSHLYVNLKNPYGVNKHRLFFLTGIGMNLLLIAVVISIKGDLTFDNLLHVRFWDIFFSTIQCIAFLYLCDFVISYCGKLFRKKPNSALRYLAEVFTVMVIGFCFTYLLVLVFLRVSMPDVPRTARFIEDVNRSRMIFLDFLLITYACMRGFHFFSFLKQKELEHIKWQSHISHTNFEALKNQLNPHFLFNSLSILISLIHSSPHKAEDFIEKLSKAYRYLLDQRDKELIPLAIELEFLKNLDFILKQRFPHKVRIDFPHHAVAGVAVVPYTLILIMEHLISTNRMSDEKPLEVRISVNLQMLVIEHSHSPRVNKKANEQLMLLQERYEQLSGTRPATAAAGGKQRITIPLLPL